MLGKTIAGAPAGVAAESEGPVESPERFPRSGNDDRRDGQSVLGDFRVEYSRCSGSEERGAARAVGRDVRGARKFELDRGDQPALGIEDCEGGLLSGN